MSIAGEKEQSVYIYAYRWSGGQELPSHELLRRAVSRYLGTEIAEITVCRDEEHGKPYIRELLQVHFSISHSADRWACAVSGAEVGLDLQEARIADGEKLARRFFHPSEIAWLAENGFEEFTKLWTCKESYVKYTGTGLREGLDYFSVVDGSLPVCQQEIPFREGFYMVVTTGEKVPVHLLCED